MAIVETRELSKRFGSTWALSGLNVSVPQGNIVALLGPNGSGKSTLLKLIAGLHRPTSGQVLVGGETPSIATKAKVAYLPEIDYLYGWMSVGEHLRYVAAFYADWNWERARELLQFMNLKESARVGKLSKGMRARFKIVLAMARSADLLLLDEPLSGIDPSSRARVLQAILSEYRRASQTVLISTHDIKETESMFDDVLFLKDGKLALHGEADALRQQKGMSIHDLFAEVYE